MYISTEEITDARIKMGDHASNMTDQEVEELLCQIKKMVTLAVEIVERMEEEKKNI